MIGSVLAWWVVTSILGWVALPIAWRLFGQLSDRGYGFSRVLGIMATSYLLWIGTSLGWLRNTLGGAIGAVVILAVMSLWMGSKRWREIGRWLRAEWRTILVMELLFLVAFVFWSFVRANDPKINHTEQPMELAFLNGILSSDTFPPRDPWLSGYAISYYYFGYVQMGLLTRLTGVLAGVAFNLTNSMWFALSILGTYTLLYNLLTRRGERPRLAAAFMGPLFVIVSGNIEGFLEFLHTRHVFWGQDASGNFISSFWNWLNLENLVNPPLAQVSSIPARNWWWWRASRVVHDVNLSGASIEVIDEFPFFSFLLADNHPHVLALPFVLLVIGFALQLYKTGIRSEIRLGEVELPRHILRNAIIGLLIVLLIFVGISTSSAAAEGLESSEVFFAMLKATMIGLVLIGLLVVLLLLLTGRLPSSLSQSEFWLGAWLFGGLIFLNTWDFPIYFFILLAVILWSARGEKLSLILKRALWTTLGVTIAGVILYLPWFPGFGPRQAGGVLPNVIFPTRLPHFLIMFATAFIPILVWLVVRVRHNWRRSEIRWMTIISVGLPLFLLLLSLALGVVIAFLLQGSDPMMWGDMLSHMGAVDTQAIIRAVVEKRITNSWTALILGATIAASGLLFIRRIRDAKETDGEIDGNWPFVLMMIMIGALLILAPEFLYLKDQFGTRMNTIFKFYFAAWILWGLAAAYATCELWPRSFSWGGVLRTLVIIPLLMGLFYPIMTTWTKTNGFNPPDGRTLDGSAYLALYQPSDYAAMQWINDHLDGGIVAEAIIGPASYKYYSRISTHTNLDTVIGWPGHESQWRGGSEEQGSRINDVQQLYQSRDWMEAHTIIDLYEIDYVYIGPLEWSTYNSIDVEKFKIFMDLIYENSEVSIFGLRSEGRP
ncbi:MAG: hypothetical protein AMJ88_04230 [Anaerolineae bacterium SM23_ 63]|nr:MAG: hypothetical protein AMJ88_04230 [Anaerolineae bacterium SM23_ 63]